MESVLVNEVIESAQSYVAERVSLSGIELVQALDPLVQSVRADRSLLRYVFFSMIVNAVSHLHGSGVVSIVSGCNTEDAVEIKVSTRGCEAVAGDAGRDDSDRVSNVSQVRVGLPLSVVRDIIEGQGGSMRWENDSDGELSFTVYLPVN